METDKLSPEQSLELITQVISQARHKVEGNWFLYVFWGALAAIASISQFFLLKNGSYDIHWYPYFLMPIGWLWMGYYFSKKKEKGQENQISKMITSAWIFLAINMMVLGFIFAPLLKGNLIPIILILLSMGPIISGIALKSNLIFMTGVLINLSAFICFYIDWMYQPLLMGVVSIIAILIPGLILMREQKMDK